MRACVALAAAILLLACAEGEPDATVSTVARASLLLEPPTIGLGDVTTAVLLVTTPPGHRVLPPTLPPVPGVWVLESLVDPTQKSATRWLHRTRIRLRPRETGSYVFPAGEVAIESDAGERTTLRYSEREFEVASILPSFPERTAPFGLQRPEAPGGPSALIAAAAIGGAVALLGAAAIARLRRGAPKRATEPDTATQAASPPSLVEWSQREIAEAFEALEAKPREAANRAAHFVRHYAESRFRTEIAASTTEELAVRKPPLAAHSHWPELVSVLRRLDELRWRPASDARAPHEEVERTRAALDAARAFLDRSSPGARA